MPDVKNLHPVVGFRDIVEDTVGAENDLAQRAASTARIGRADERERRKDADVVENAFADPWSSIRVVLGDIGADGVQICESLFGPDYLKVHALAHDSSNCSVCWCVLVRPATTSARPF